MGDVGVPTSAFQIACYASCLAKIRPVVALTQIPQRLGSPSPQAPTSPAHSLARRAAGSLLRHASTAPPGRTLSPTPPPPGAGAAFWKVREGVGRVPLLRGGPESASIRLSRAHGEPP